MRDFFSILYIILCVDLICALKFRNICKQNNNSPAIKLRNYILCEYDPENRPGNHKNATPVTMQIRVAFFNYNQETEEFEVHMRTILVWKDTHLTWDPKEHDNLYLILVPAYKIWMPDITLYNTHLDENVLTEKAKCWITSKGEVHRIFSEKYTTYCMVDNTWWPYNVLNCSIHFGSWAHSDNEIYFEGLGNLASMVNLGHYMKNVEWDLLKVDVTKRKEEHKYDTNSTVKIFSFHFLIKRHWNIVYIVYVMPTVVLMMMTLTTLWLEPKSYERMTLANINFVCHLLCIVNVHWEMPKSGANTPLLIIVYEKSLLMALFTLILTSILRQLQELTTEPPAWISAVTASIVRSRVGQILLISILDPAATAKIEVFADDNTDLVQSNIKKSPWNYITVLIGWFAFLSILFAYTLLFATCFPTNFKPNI